MTEPLMGVREAARAIGVNPSTVTRYIAKYPELIASASGPPKVDLARFVEHRKANVNEIKSGNHAGLLFTATASAAPPASAAPDEDDAETQQPRERRSPDYAHARTARETISARLEQIKLDEKLKLLVSRREVEDMAVEAGLAFRDGLITRNRDLADRLATMTDAIEIKSLLDQSDAQLLARIADAFERRISDTDPVD